MADPVLYMAKASRRERDAGLEAIEPKLITEADKWAVNDRRSGTARQPTEWKQRPVRNIHVAVKPISLCIWLAKLLAPPPEYTPRRLLVPFSGSGSEVCAAILSGCWEEIVAVEMSEEYCEIAEGRAAWWTARMQEMGSSDPKAILKAHGKKKGKSPAGQEQLILSLEMQENGE